MPSRAAASSRGPEPGEDPDFSGNRIATSQLWIGNSGWNPPTNPWQYQGLGTLLVAVCPDPKVYFCPADDNFEMNDSLPKIGTDEDAYGSYLYRQLDHLPPDRGQGILDCLGTNEIDEQLVPVEALAMDMNSLGPAIFHHTCHRARVANILFRDASVRLFTNRENCLALPEEAFLNPAGLPRAIDQLLTNADVAYRGGRPQDAPHIEPP